MPLQPFSRDRRCPHCGACRSLYLEEVMGDTDLVCITCGYRRTGVIPRRPSPPALARQEPLPIPLSGGS